jgi:hypothetical protein
MGDFQTNKRTVLDPATGQGVTFDCGKWMLCSGFGSVCNCNAASCTVDLTYGETAFDMKLSGDHLDGSITASNPNVHFTRSPADPGNGD